MALSDWDPVAANNATTLGVNIGEGTTAPSAVNNALRQILADVATGINVSLLGTFLSSTTLAQARTALGVTEGGASQTAFAALTNTANSVPYMTGSDAWATTTLTSFGRSLIDDGDAATALATLGIALSGSASSGSFSFGTFKLQWIDFTAASGTTTAVSFPSAYTSWSRAWVNARNTDTDAERNTTVSASTTTGATVTNSYPGAISSTLFSIGV